MNKSRVIAVIPARSGSKGLPDKNIKLLNGIPLLAHTVIEAKESGVFDCIHVSTDSQKYADIAKRYGANEPFLRDADNASDYSSSWDAVREALAKYQKIGESFDICILLQPTSPLRNRYDISGAYKQFIAEGAKTLTSVTEVDHPVQWCFKLDKNHSMDDFSNSSYRNCRRQDLDKYYHENGAIYIAYTKDIEDRNFDFYMNDCYAYLMDRKRSVDIDTLEDFICAEALIDREGMIHEE